MEVTKCSKTEKKPCQLKQCAFGAIRRRFCVRFASCRLALLGTIIIKTNLDNAYGCALALSAKRCSPRNSNLLKDYPSCTMEQNKIKEQNFARGLDFLDLFFHSFFSESGWNFLCVFSANLSEAWT